MIIKQVPDDYEDVVMYLRESGGQLAQFGYAGLDDAAVAAVAEVVLFCKMLEGLEISQEDMKLLRARAASLFSRAYDAGYEDGTDHGFDNAMARSDRLNAREAMEKTLQGDEVGFYAPVSDKVG